MNDTPFLVLVGTKAQFIKTAPLLREMDRRNVAYQLVYTGQHSETFDLLEAAFGTRAPDDQLVPGTEASTHGSFLAWTLSFWWQAIKRLRRWRGARAGLVHGDTASTLFGAIALRLAGVPVVHVEAGLRSTRLLEPFPEEIVRRLVSRLARLHLAPDRASAANLAGVRGTVVDTRGNTLRDALALALGRWPAPPRAGGLGGYAVVSMHRAENLGRKEDFDLLMGEVLHAASMLPVRFVLHPATRERIRASQWSARLEAAPQLQLLERMDYPDFIELLVGSCCLLTDGGSNQEEAAMLGLPTLLLRRATERLDGLDNGIELSHLKPEAIRAFVARHAGSSWTLRAIPEDSPSARVIEALEAMPR
ncbi:UDP-N-acetylglucosamine 2-epimerase [Stenotrophomonas mori]|uniref:UDP-N-acetylglucosamine 2-epimerase (non-hydrolyzing) n=1 Tax=Stenotrophomonas mori TaxID=2871096 RepID=A0ABT0SDJ9_9GAMM|nr:UDP-N-acetylglucosamine 2-epimerase [Stenotrophomonas mori]MCL7713181.1 UDP-N-acetylglucosamine 2-epimerase [Stenotrophomonas mori]